MAWLGELKKRKVFRVAAAYAVVGWLLVQVTAVVLPALNLPAWTVTFTTVLLMLGFPVALLLAWSFDVVRASGRPGAADAASAAVVARSVLVLPFANMSEDAAQTHFADGIVEDLTTRLQAIGGLKVLSRQSAFAYQGRSVDARTISRELGCQYVVEGSVRKIDNRIRVTAQLIDAPKDEHVWAERYDRRLEDAFALQDEICDRIVAAIETRLAPAVVSSAAVAGPAPAAPAADAPAVAIATVPTGGRRVESVRQVLRSWWTVPGALALIALAGALTWTLQQRSRERWAREEALPQLEALIANDDYQAAFDLAARIEQVIPNDPRLKALRPSFTTPVNLTTEPDGATISYRPYSSNETDWRPIGTTPLQRVTLPTGFGLWKVDHAGYVPGIFAMRNPGVQLRNHPEPHVRARAANVDFTLHLADSGTAPRGMVLVQSDAVPIPFVSEQAAVDLPPFYIDRYEVTNREYKEFVDAGGYARAEMWRDLPFDEIAAGWQTAVTKFVDATGRPGPATWDAGTYRDGTAEQPVTGVSWFEAVAYARFRGKELPTAYHWYRAAMSPNERLESLGTAIVNVSNFTGKGVAPVGQHAGIGPYGTYDMAGNAREWLWNVAPSGRLIAGGAWNTAPYLFLQLDAAPPWDRSPGNGIRCMRTQQTHAYAAKLRDPIVPTSIDYSALIPVSDEAYAVLAQQLDYSSAALDTRVEPLESTNPLWTRQRITIATGYDDSRFAVQLFLPTAGTPPYHPVVYMPHAGFTRRYFESDQFDPTESSQPLDFILKSGRALVVVALDGTFERYWQPALAQSMSVAERYRVRLRHARQEIGRTIDYLATRDDIDVERLGWFGVSWGAQAMVPVLAVEKRFRSAVLDGGGIYLLDIPAAEQFFNYLPRITQPVLMLNGRWDIDVPPDTQRRFFELLGTPPADKQHVLFEAGHSALPQNQLVRATLDWYDKYLGPTAERMPANRLGADH
jgi:TolB-like protein/formylglycine-generating enzyme required for sulfatase activity/dienelactone hydrolase